MLPSAGILSLALALLAASGEAIKVTSPTTTTVQSANDALDLKWDSVSTDPTSFAVVLVNQNAAYLPNSPITLVANQSTSAGSTSLSYPSGSWPAGTAFQINLVKSTSETNSILAQSDMFNITASTSSSASSSASSSSSSSAASSSAASSASSSASTTQPSIVQSASSAVYSGNAQTGSPAIPSGSGSGTSAAGMTAPVVGGSVVLMSGLLAVGAAALL